MKKSLLLLSMLLICIGGHAQTSKKKKSTKAKTTAVAGPKSLAKSDNLSVDYAKNELFLTINGAVKDTVSLRRNGLSEPTEVTIKPITCSGNTLYHVTWTEKKKSGDAKTKLEDITQKHTMIVDVATKAKVLENIESANHITEKVYLSADKYVSETQEKVRREGMECSVAADGSVVLKNKSTQTKLVYDAAKKKFVAKK
ncbi:MAG: hypothetical protein EOO50_12190 [Flavobacterium sp.]|uniref:hypothetical protein n=1 Tax=Flavobacterium sp. TaxID=239 RepID=UPI00121F3164|nr:hypothetical protein [Flavobacterium sp.]RZJ65873.1 MAG: hypothetical protein EOO50_12190 [Flavobacterium sp.]